MTVCPKCGSKNCYVHDKGWEFLLRLILWNNRLVCRDCRTTWRLRTPEKFAKLKRKSPLRSGKKLSGYHLIPMGMEMLHFDTQQMLSLVAEWQESGTLFVCLEFHEVPSLDHQALSNLMQWHRELKAVGGNLIVNSVNPQINESLWALNLGYLLKNKDHILAIDLGPETASAVG